MFRAWAISAIISAGFVTLMIAAGPSPDRAQAAFKYALDSGDSNLQREKAWEIFAGLTATHPAFEKWRGEAQVFADPASNDLPLGMAGFSREGIANASFVADAGQSAGAPVFAYTFFNDPAFHHIRNKELNSTAGLTYFREHGDMDNAIAGARTIPPFPSTAIVVKTVWWPISAEHPTVLPVWDPESNPPLRAGNSYLTWNRVVRVQPAAAPRTISTTADFGGRRFEGVREINVDAFYHIRVDRELADRAMRDPMTKNLVLFALGRELRAGDILILVGANIATHQLKDWIWIAVWWHDRSNEGPFAVGRPSSVVGVWRNYLMSTTFDPELPRTPAGGSNICFNPWLEGRFPDKGQGGGTVSNCMACHRRASYPAVNFLPVRRGGAIAADDEAYDADRLRTSFLWTLPLHTSE